MQQLMRVYLQPVNAVFAIFSAFWSGVANGDFLCQNFSK
jgi:hypothetical protein